MTDRFEGDVVLRDGSLVHVRKATLADLGLLKEFLVGLSPKSISSRFQGKNLMTEELVKYVAPSEDRFTLVAEREKKLVAEADFMPSGPRTAVAAVVVADAYQQKGLGTTLLAQLSQAASASGIASFTIVTPAGAHYGLNFVKDMGYPVQVGASSGFVAVTFPTSIAPAGLEAFEKSEAVSAVAAVVRFLKPESIAVIGASRDRGSIGGALFRNIIEGEFKGPVYPVNRESAFVQSVTAYKSVKDCPGPVGLAFVVVPAKHVVGVATECGEKGVGAIVVISSGFAEVGGAGQKLQEELVEVCRESGIRLIGPNCMGIVNTDPEVSLNGQFAPVKCGPGKIAFLSQSGALGYAIIDQMDKLGLGMSSFVSVGNKADISSNDMIQYWEEDENTGVILLHLESFGDPRKFARLAKRVVRKKPIVVVKSGRSAAGFRATQSHTGAIVASSDVRVDALFDQAGVIRTDTLEEMFDVAAFLSTQPVPEGNRVAIVTNAGGPGILAADACEGLGLLVPELSETTKAELAKFLPPIAGRRNPVDMTSGATPQDYGRAIRIVSKDQNVDALIVIFIPPLAFVTESVASEIVGAAEELKGKKPVIATFMAAQGISGQLSGGTVRVPAYLFPESGARALAHAVRRRRWLSEPRGRVVSFPEARKLEAAAVVSRALAEGREWLGPVEVHDLLRCYDIPQVKDITVGTPDEAAKEAADFSGRVVLKASSPGLVHKTEIGGVRVGLAPAEVGGAAREMQDKLGAKGIRKMGFLVQEMVEDATEMFVGVTNDPNFGPLIACGAGGTLVELIRDVAVKLTPLADTDATEMVRSLKTFPVLEGYRGGPRRDVSALEEVILRLGALVEDHPEVAELDLNPVFVLREGAGALVADARVRVAEGKVGLPLGAKKR
jgi:acetate---CoA ligase (ADP-forming)